MSCAHLCKQGVATLAQADWANAEHCPAGLGLDLRAAGLVARGFVRRLAVERWRCPRRSGHLCEVPRGSREGPAGGMWGGVAGWGSRDVLIKLFWPGGPQVVAHHGIHGNAPMLDPAFACGDNLARQSLGLGARGREGNLVLTTRSGAREVLLAHGRKRVKIRREFLDAIVALVDLVATGGAV